MSEKITYDCIEIDLSDEEYTELIRKIYSPESYTQFIKNRQSRKNDLREKRLVAAIEYLRRYTSND